MFGRGDLIFGRTFAKGAICCHHDNRCIVGILTTIAYKSSMNVVMAL